MTRTNQIVEFEVAADIRRAGGCIGKGDAKLVADTINQWKCGAIAIVYYSSFGMSRDVEKFRSSVKSVAEAAAHDALITGRQVFLLNMLGNWPAYPELEEPSEPEGYWWMSILYERSTLQVSILAPVYRAYRNQDVWSINFGGLGMTKSCLNCLMGEFHPVIDSGLYSYSGECCHFEAGIREQVLPIIEIESEYLVKVDQMFEQVGQQCPMWEPQP